MMAQRGGAAYGAFGGSSTRVAMRAAASARLSASGRAGVHFPHNALMALRPVAVIRPSR